jgi:hypothetical protein
VIPCESDTCAHGQKHARHFNLQATWMSLALTGRLTLENWDKLCAGELKVPHLCGNASCVEPAHVLVESGSTNKSRESRHGHLMQRIRIQELTTTQVWHAIGGVNAFANTNHVAWLDFKWIDKTIKSSIWHEYRRSALEPICVSIRKQVASGPVNSK